MAPSSFSAPVVRNLPGVQLIGISQRMSLVDNQTVALFRRFMPRRNVPHRTDDVVYDLIDYPPDYFQKFDARNDFVKWAAVAVSRVPEVPEGMQLRSVAAGTYAVFVRPAGDRTNRIFDHIFRTWLPASPYVLDDRPHFDRIAEDRSRPEEIHIPVRPRLK